MNLLITGASGFVGGFIVEKALEEGHQVIAAIRKTTNKKYLQDSRIKFVELNLSNQQECSDKLSALKTEHGNIDVVIHNAGVTKAIDSKEFDKVNYQFTVNLITAIHNSTLEINKFIYTSSLAASGPGKPHTNIPIRSSSNNNPVTNYGRSKLKAENYLESLEDFPYLILRPSPVFGPRDKDMFEVFDLVNKGFEIYAGFSIQNLSLIYVKDLADAIVTVAASQVTRKKYFISDGKKYSDLILNKLIKKSMGKKTIVIKLPIFLLYLVAFFIEIYSKISMKPSPLNVDKVNELKSSNWICDASDFHSDTNFEAKYTLEQGIEETIAWYKKEKWM